MYQLAKQPTSKDDPRKQPKPGYAEKQPSKQFPVGSGSKRKNDKEQQS